VQLAGLVIWLKASVESLAKRIAADESTQSRRPNLTAAGGMHGIATILAIREPIYRACATLEVDTEGKTSSAIVDEIMTSLA
jgi:shikimate kinase